jgi:hypothetical protein
MNKVISQKIALDNELELLYQYLGSNKNKSKAEIQEVYKRIYILMSNRDKSSNGFA